MINHMMGSLPSQQAPSLLRATRCNDRHSRSTSQLDRSNTNTPRGAMNQHDFTRNSLSTKKEGAISRVIGDADGSALCIRDTFR